MQELLTRMSGSAPPSGLVTAVFRETEGNPFFVEEVYQHLSEEGTLFDDSGAWKTDLRVGTIAVPEGARLVIGRRLDRLGEQARKVLTAGAVIGRTFPLDLLLAVVDLSDDAVLDAIEEAERAQLVAADASQRTVRYGFVHELIRTTLVTTLSLPRRQRLHLKIADALERLRAASLESHASVLAHHLYQAGAAADSGRTATFLLLAGRRAMAAGAFEETLATFDQMLGLELPEDDPRLGEASEHRGEALAGLQRYDDAVAAFERALTIYAAIRDDAGIARAARGASDCCTWRGQLTAGLSFSTRGLRALSTHAARERALLLAWMAVSRVSPAHLDEAWQAMDEAAVIAERLAEPVVLGPVLGAKCICHSACGELEAAVATGRAALSVVAEESVWERAYLLLSLTSAETLLGQFTVCEERLPELATAATRSGNHPALWFHNFNRSRLEFARTGDIRAYRSRLEPLLATPFMKHITRPGMAACLLYLGDVDQALEHLATAIQEQPADNAFQGSAEASLFAATALAGQHDRARALLPTVTPWLPVAGRRNVLGAYFALDACVTGLALVGDRDQRGALYPLTLVSIRTGLMVSSGVGPSNPQLAAALAADAAGVVDQSREHFETALRQARDLPIRILQPTVLYWYGRTLSAAADIGDRERGRGMVEAALTDFRVLEMVLHANLAERFLREGR